jgi:hypothetical protein
MIPSIILPINKNIIDGANAKINHPIDVEKILPINIGLLPTLSENLPITGALKNEQSEYTANSEVINIADVLKD